MAANDNVSDYSKRKSDIKVGDSVSDNSKRKSDIKVPEMDHSKRKSETSTDKRKSELSAEKRKSETSTDKRKSETSGDKRKSETSTDKRKPEGWLDKRKSEGWLEKRKSESNTDKRKSESNSDKRKSETNIDKRKSETNIDYAKRKSETKAAETRTDLIRVRLHPNLAVPAAYITFQENNKQSALAWKRQALVKLNQKFQCEINAEDCVLMDSSSCVIPDNAELNGAEIRLLTLMHIRPPTNVLDGVIDRTGLALPNPDSHTDASPRSSDSLQPTPSTYTSTPSSSPPQTPRRLELASTPETKEDFTSKLGSDFIQRLKNLEDGDLLALQAKSLIAQQAITKGGYMTRRHGFRRKRRYCALLGARLIVCRMKSLEFSVELILSLDGALVKLIESKAEDKDTTFSIQTSDKKEYVFIAPDSDWFQILEKATTDRSSSSLRSMRSQMLASTLTGFDAMEMEVLSWLQLHEIADGLEKQLSKVTSIVLLLLELDGKQLVTFELLRSALIHFTPPTGLQALVDWKWEANGEEGLSALLETLNKDTMHKLTPEELKPLWARARMRLDPSLAVPISHMSFATTKRQSVKAWKLEAVTKLNAKFMGGLDANECNLTDASSVVLADAAELNGLDLYGLTLVAMPKAKQSLREVKTPELEVLLWLEQHELAADLSSSMGKVTSVVVLLLELDPKTVTIEELHAQLATFAPPLCLKALVEWKPRDVEVVEKQEVLALLEVLNLDAARKLTYDEFKPLLAQLAQSKQDDLVRVRLDESLMVPIAYITCSMNKAQSAKSWKHDIIVKLNSKCIMEVDPADCVFVNANNKPLDDDLELQRSDLKSLTLTKMKVETLEEVVVESKPPIRVAPKDSAQLALASRNDIQQLLRKVSAGAWNRLIFYGLDPVIQIEALQNPVLPDCDPVSKQVVLLHDLIMMVASSLPGSQKMALLVEEFQVLDSSLEQPIRQVEILLDLFMNLQDADLKCKCEDLERKSIPAGTNDCFLLIMHSFLSIGGMDCLLENMLNWTGVAAYDHALEWTVKIIWLLEITQAKHISCGGAIELDLCPTEDCWWQENALSKCVGLLEDPPLTVFVALFEIANEKLETFRDRKSDYEALVRIQSFRNVRMFNVMELGWKNARFAVLEQCLEYVVCCQSQKKNIVYLLSDPLWYRYFIPLLLNGGSQSSFNINARTTNSAEAEAKVETVLRLAVSACVSVLHGAFLGLGVEPAPTPVEESKPTFSTLLLSFSDGVEEIALWTPDTVMIIHLVLQALLTKVSHSLTSFCHDPSSPTWEYFFQLCSAIENFVFYSPTMESPLRSIEDRRFTHFGMHGDDDVILVELLLECIAGLKIDSLFVGGFDPVVKKLCSKITQRVLEEQEFWKSTIEFLRFAGSVDQKTLEKTKAYKTCEAGLKQRRSRSKIVKKHATLEAKRIRRALRVPTSVRKAKDPSETPQKPLKQTSEQAFWKLHSEALASAQVAREQRAQQFVNKNLLSRSRPFPKPNEPGSKAFLTERRSAMRRTTMITPSQEELKLEKEILRVRSRRMSFSDVDDDAESTWQEVRNRGLSLLDTKPRGSFSLRRNSGEARRLSLSRRNSGTEIVLRAQKIPLSTHRNSGTGPGSPAFTMSNSARRSISFPPDGGTFPFANLFKPDPSSPPIVSVSLVSAAVSAASSPTFRPASGKFPVSSSPSSSPPPSPQSSIVSPPKAEHLSEPSTPTSLEPTASPKTLSALSLPPTIPKPANSRTFFERNDT